MAQEPLGNTLTDIEIMRTGTFTASKGREETLTDAHLEHIAGAYEPGYHEAPVVIGHPPSNGRPTAG